MGPSPWAKSCPCGESGPGCTVGFRKAGLFCNGKRLQSSCSGQPLRGRELGGSLALGTFPWALPLSAGQENWDAAAAVPPLPPQLFGKSDFIYLLLFFFLSNRTQK